MLKTAQVIFSGFIGTMICSSTFAATQWQQLEHTLSPYLASESALTRYHAHKANMWLTYAKNEKSENSLTVAGQEALSNSQAIIKSLDQAQQISTVTPIISVSQVMRRDLWGQIEYFKQQGGLETAPQALAEAEVMLVWAAGEYCELGWRHAKAHFFAVEQRLYQVKQTLAQLPTVSYSASMEQLPSLQQLNGKGCQGVNAEYWPIIAHLEKPKNQVDDVIQPSAILVENVIHFALDRAELNTEGKNVLGQISQLLKQHQDIQITLVGHTDMRASQAYNLKLSQRRINTVRDYLVAQGVAVERIAEQAKGKQDLISDVEQTVGHAKSRRVVIEFHDVEGKTLHVQPQWRDLQLEMK